MPLVSVRGCDARWKHQTAGSVILAGVLLKMGGYGFLRFSVPMFPDATEYFIPMVFGLSVIAIIYIVCGLCRQDMKKDDCVFFGCP